VDRGVRRGSRAGSDHRQTADTCTCTHTYTSIHTSINTHIHTHTHAVRAHFRAVCDISRCSRFEWIIIIHPTVTATAPVTHADPDPDPYNRAFVNIDTDTDIDTGIDMDSDNSIDQAQRPRPLSPTISTFSPSPCQPARLLLTIRRRVKIALIHATLTPLTPLAPLATRTNVPACTRRVLEGTCRPPHTHQRSGVALQRERHVSDGSRVVHLPILFFTGSRLSVFALLGTPLPSLLFVHGGEG
jgi:hypothetical protein